VSRDELKRLWHKALADPSEDRLYSVAEAIVDLYGSDSQFRAHIMNRSTRVTERTGVAIDPDNFTIESARAFVTDEIGFAGWNDLVLATRRSEAEPILFCYTVAAMDRGDFTALEETIGPERFHDQIVEWFEKGLFENELETLNEIFAASCMLGQTEAAEYLLNKGVDPYAGMKTGLAGFHWAASSGKLDVIKMLIQHGVPMEVKNMYGGTVFGQAIWSAIHENKPQHGSIVEVLMEAGAEIEDGYPEWWAKQDIPDAETKTRIAQLFERRAEFHKRIATAQEAVSDAESNGNKRILADSLKALGNILRRPPFLREQANTVYERAANIYKDLGLPLEEAWVKRHIGINHEYAERLEDAEKYYDASLGLFRQHAGDDDNNYANTVRYPAVIKNRLGKREESRELWEEACRRYENIHPSGLGEGVAEAAAWLTIFAIDKGDLALASKWFAKASEASSKSNDPDTHKFVDEVRVRLESAR
jgi:ankyrin repeat protein